MDNDNKIFEHKTFEQSAVDLPLRRRLTVQQLEQLEQLGLSCHLPGLQLSGLRLHPLHPESSEKNGKSEHNINMSQDHHPGLG